MLLRKYRVTVAWARPRHGDGAEVVIVHQVSPYMAVISAFTNAHPPLSSNAREHCIGVDVDGLDG